jgi:hypothetical protein
VPATHAAVFEFKTSRIQQLQVNGMDHRDKRGDDAK